MKVKFSSSEDNDNDNDNEKGDSSSDDLTSSVSSSFDALIVGGGIMGVCIARDLASSGYQVAIVEREAALGGVWRHNDYPGLRLQGVGTAWRCLSLAPDFHKQTTTANSNHNQNNQHNSNPDINSNQHKNSIIQNNNSNTNHQHQTNTNTNTNTKINTTTEKEKESSVIRVPDNSRLLYCPLASETLSYIQSMADHPNITVLTNTSYEGLMNANKKKKTNTDNDNDNGQNNNGQQQHSTKLCSTIDTNPNKTKTINATHTIGGGDGITQQQPQEKKKKRLVSAHTVILAVGYTTHNSGTPWLPIDRTAVTNGATILHSAELSNKHHHYQQQLKYWKWLLNLLFTTALTTLTTTTTSPNNNGNQHQLQQQQQQQQKSATKSKANNTAIMGTTYVVGGQKAAIEVLKSMDPTDDDNVVWALRRRDGIFLKKEVLDEVLVATARTNTPVSWFMSRLMRLVPTLIYFGKFQMAESLLLTLGMGVRVGKKNIKDTDTASANNVPSFRGGIVRQEDIEHARKFKQTIITNVGINSNGAVVLKQQNRNIVGDNDINNDCNNKDESSSNDMDMVVGPNDRIIFCTGQRTGQSTDEYLNMAVNHSTNGLFVALPYSSQACAAAAYTTKLVLDYLDNNDTGTDTGNSNGNNSLITSSNSTSSSNSNTYYSSGKFKASLEKLASHVQQVPVPGSSSGRSTENSNSHNEWAKVVVMLSGVGLQFPNQILPNVRGDLALSPQWTSAKVLGKNLDARATLQELAKPDYGGWYTMATVGVTLLGFRFAKRHFLALSKFKK